MSHRASLLGRGNRDLSLDSPRVRFRRALALCLLTIVAPGSAQLSMGNRVVGRVALTLWVLTLGGAGYLGYLAYTDRARVINYFTDTDVLLAARIVLITAVVAWLFLFIDAWRLAAPFRLTFLRGAFITVLNFAIVVGVAGSTAYASRVMEVSRETVTQVFTATETSEPLDGRYNILLLGSDSGKGRTGLRPDSMTVASIDTSTGKTVLISLPRNLQNVPFADDSPMKQVYPYGFSCGPECLLNAVHTAAQNRTDLYPGAEDPGLEATFDAIEGVTGLKLNYYVMVNLKGFRSLVNAVGGVEMDVKTRIAMFGKEDAWKNVYLEPGKQVLDGNQALWYARSRVQSDDYTRMGRQKCLMAAMAEQLSPQKVVLNASEIAKSGRELLSTNIPAKELGQFADLALKSRGATIGTVSLVPPEVDVTNPDFVAIRQLINEAIAKSESNVQDDASDPTDDTTSTTPTSPTSTPTKDPTGRAANQSDDLKDAC